ncbi:MAG TPA: precorrin-2 C(20)-methyltransferase [Gordonia sp. (in: high G+C Gram-positive bacteria)]|uniref:precorrin-2 C(20)-methyltransferase n=1 Tax=unclassified Gordonia (in: high G+C Gram-positive bacteria) TaxID=2657482 RepID=UPI000FAF3212|nr:MULTISPECIES: precorrin-2 C(20)-methyltransferase [unclassified Gordonia (in: high G+C Gram-positive bacteria)]RUP38662.1 MAG: precorrin-2 C(20)-methyltransferase [Gordonia sp. (in: high G+C Gram-positive bacteria)]HNP56342.1 precorrin-2 C(20)-methyltransferase [Gordonia sp. (in: high G+C Gram-positive bacteria)]HRC50026.1 precorrin-2 C(20)-methyltransferase [Gordonia sp. (in: high G+C Gram-positive bacteria)]
MTGTLYGVGLGPGDSELVTVKAARLISAADVIAYHCARHGRSIARGVAVPYLRDGQIEERLMYPVTTETVDHPGGYDGAMADFYTESAARLADHLAAGRDVVLLAEGDPLFFSSYMHMHKRLAGRFATEIVPGVTSVSGASAALGIPLVEGEENLVVLPGTAPDDELVAQFASGSAIAVLKLGRTFERVRAALRAAGRLDEAWYVERATTAAQRVERVVDVDPASVPYFSMIVVPGATNNPLAPQSDAQTGGGVTVVGLGPGPADQQTPQVRAALAAATDLIGYTTYLSRVTPRPGQQVHASDNRVESQRAEFALDLARRGRRVVVVSSGDPGVFAMATAVAEVAAQEPYTDVEVTVLPGVTAASAVAAAFGAPLGHDLALISLSDRLKPWDVIARRVTAAVEADLVVAVYNPGSASRDHQVADLRQLLSETAGPDRVVLVGRDVGGPSQALTVTTVGDLDPSTVDMRTLLIIGSSTTVVAERPGGRLVFTPRRYEV